MLTCACAHSNELGKHLWVHKCGVRSRIRFASARSIVNILLENADWWWWWRRLRLQLRWVYYTYMFDINELYLNLGFWLAACAYVLCIFGFIESHTRCTLHTHIRSFVGLHIRAKCTNRLRCDSIRFDFALYANGEKRLVWFIQTTWVMRNAHPNTLNSHRNALYFSIHSTLWDGFVFLLHNMSVCFNPLPSSTFEIANI